MDFPFGCHSLPNGRFRLKPCRSVAASDTRLPLSPHCNPLSALWGKSAEVFSTTSRVGSILFCRHGFKRQYRSQPRPRPETLRSSIPACPRKAGYTAHSTRFCAPHCRFYSCFVRSPGCDLNATGRLSHNSRSPRKSGRSVYAITPRPKALTPSTHPNLGEKSKHQGLHRYAL